MRITFFRTLFFFGLLILSSCASKIIIPVENSAKADIAITAPSKAVLFVEKKSNNDTEQRQIHKYISNEIYNTFGGATDRMFVSSTNAESLKFTTTDGKSWFIDVNKLEHPFAMVVFDNHKPFIEYNPEKYMQIVTSKFEKEINDATPLPKKVAQKSKPKETSGSAIDSILNIKFNPDKKYAELVIKNSNNIYYPLPPFEEDAKPQGLYKITSYANSKKENENYTSFITYDNNNRIINYRWNNKEYDSETKYHLNKLGLLDSIVGTSNTNEPDKFYFKYLPDRFICYSKSYNFRNEFIFNEKNQVIEQKSYIDNNELRSINYYIYDDLGRVLEETEYEFDEQKLYKTIKYTYISPKSNSFKSMIYYDNEYIKNFEILQEKNKNILTSKNYVDGKLNAKIIYDLDKNGVGKSYNEDGEGNITSVEFFELIKK
ncbi:hypothetical protein [Flavobacterium sp. I3-2]|uniref:hypothetical protein n=1 Tax=Flavobacterium sp. I3-2 TaxID=2748319 RepID=UPI0015A9F54F|nr:hypothetical protein [Flavobacterium sp. I3-2]